jgi:predicted amidohydrolase
VEDDRSKIVLGLVKAVPVKGDPEHNHSKLMSILADADAHRIDVIITPECFLDGYVSTEEHVTNENITDFGLDPDSSEYVNHISEWAGSTSTWVVFGCTRVEGDSAYNSALVFNRQGDLAGIYDKTHLQNHDKKFSAGTSLPVFKSDFGLFGVMICADRRWPETVRTLALKGARIIFNPTFGMHDKRNLHMMQTRSYESEIFIAFTHPKQSLVTGPKGEIVSSNTTEDEGITITEIDLSETDKARDGKYGHLKDRRPEIYM